MPRKGWVSISILENIAKEIDEKISNGKWTCRADFVRDAIRRLLSQTEKEG